MPKYNNTYPPSSVGFGDNVTIVSAEQLGAGIYSQRAAIADRSGSQFKPICVSFSYATVPSSVQYDIYIAMFDTGPTISYTKVGSTTNVNGDQVTLNRAAAGGNDFRFLCVLEVISPGVNATVVVSQ